MTLQGAIACLCKYKERTILIHSLSYSKTLPNIIDSQIMSNIYICNMYREECIIVIWKK